MYHLPTHRVRELMYRLDYTSRYITIYHDTAIQLYSRDTSEMMYPHPSVHDKARVEQLRHRGGAGDGLVQSKGVGAAADQAKARNIDHGDHAARNARRRRLRAASTIDLARLDA